MKKLFLLIILLSGRSYSQPGSFDLTYDGDGKVTNCLTVPALINDAAFQSSGKLVCFGGNGQSCNVTLSRINSDGTIDTTFGINGHVINTICSVFSANTYFSYKMAIQADDKIVIMGVQQGAANSYWIARLLPDGDLDPSFDTDGYLDLSFGSTQDRGTCIAIQPDGKILVGGTSGNNAEFFSLARLNSNGSLDTFFGSGGKVQTPFNGNQSWANSIAIQTDGKILLGGYTVNPPHAYDFGLLRYTINGLLDTDFGINGKVITTLDGTRSDILTKLIVEPNGSIMAGGYTSSELNPKMAMVRYLSTGLLDTNFGTNGIVISNGSGRTCGIAKQIDGKYVLGGGGDADLFEVYRYNVDGSIDTAFGTNGFVNGFPLTGGYISTILLQSDNKIVAVGSTASADFTQTCEAVIRLAPGTLDQNAFYSNLIAVYPNPTSDVVFFDNSTTQYLTVTVYNYLGQEVMEKNLQQTNDQSIEMSTFLSGVYVLKFTGHDSVENVLVVKK